MTINQNHPKQNRLEKYRNDSEQSHTEASFPFPMFLKLLSWSWGSWKALVCFHSVLIQSCLMSLFKSLSFQVVGTSSILHFHPVCPINTTPTKIREWREVSSSLIWLLYIYIFFLFVLFWHRINIIMASVNLYKGYPSIYSVYCHHCASVIFFFSCFEALTCFWI